MLSLILPTFNEAENLPLLLPRIEHILKNIPHEIIIVDDDSPDGTWRKAQEIAKEIPSVYVIRRQGERGLSTAVVAGFHAARGSVLAVMDADGQHDSSLLVQLYDAILQHRGMAVASRYIPGGGVGAWAGRRRLLSRIATKLTVLLCRIPVSDPMSGFFAIDRSLFERVSADLSPRGFKILFDLLVRVPRGTAMTEIPFTFAPRMRGKSKLSLRVQWQFLRSLIDIFFVRYAWLPWAIFTLVMIVTTAVFVPRAWAIRSLYSDYEIRMNAQENLQSIARERGWLLSDISIESIQGNTLRLEHQLHRREASTSECFMVNLPSAVVLPCSSAGRNPAPL
ncbi:MAG: polyprenol monophosphomannose synthase [Candidatus Peregrinibacteria bacterium]